VFDDRRVLVVVPARGGSQGVKLKNLRTVGGEPLVARAGELAGQLDFVDRAVVSTDHAEIARVATAAGLAAPFVRPESLSGATIGDLDVLTHAVTEMERQDRVIYDVVVMLQPTSPSRRPDQVRAVVARLVQGGYDSVWSVSPTDLKAHPLKQLVVEPSGDMRYYDPTGARIVARQQLTPLYHRNGIAYAFTRQCLLEQKTIMGKRSGAVVIDEPVFNIDTEADLERADRALGGGKMGAGPRLPADPDLIPAGTCAVCQADGGSVIYQGPIRAGVFGTFLPGAVVRCPRCAVDRLVAHTQVDESTYRTGEYREMVGEAADPEKFFKVHDGEQFEKIAFAAPHFKRGLTVADVGCGGGAFLDLVKGMAGRTVAVELTEAYHPSLRARGHQTFPRASACAGQMAEQVDLVVSFSVIEHVPDPVTFLKEIRPLLAPGGKLLVSTPNRDDLLMRRQLPEYLAFFYRQVHLFYFDAASLADTCRRAGYEVVETRFHQRFGFSNFVNWLVERRPTGRVPRPLLPASFDNLWRAELERDGSADYLYVVLAPA
jgi:CMP-N-acetylneuraminic acid synthetase/SAM-dependent methyltransferase